MLIGLTLIASLGAVMDPCRAWPLLTDHVPAVIRIQGPCGVGLSVRRRFYNHGVSAVETRIIMSPAYSSFSHHPRGRPPVPKAVALHVFRSSYSLAGLAGTALFSRAALGKFPSLALRLRKRKRCHGFLEDQGPQ